MKLLVDNQLPAALARFLCSRGLDCAHVLDVGLEEASDEMIWEYASLHNFALLTKDDDFLKLASRPQAAVQVVWVRLGNCRNKALIQAFDSVLEKLTERLKLGDRIVEIR